MVKKRKPPTTRVDRAVDRLYKAITHYVETRGGKLVVVGGVQVQEWPQDNPGVFHVAVKCMGRKPEMPTDANP